MRTDDVSLAIGEFLLATGTLQELRAYARYGGDVPADLSKYVTLDESHREYLASPAGRGDVRQWAETFKRTLEILDTLRDALIADGPTVSVPLLQEAQEAVDRAFAGFQTWIESAPTVAA